MEKYRIYLNRVSLCKNEYISKLHNAEKKRYAEELLHWLCNPNVPEPNPGNLSFMAQQAVRSRIRTYLEVA